MPQFTRRNLLCAASASPLAVALPALAQTPASTTPTTVVQTSNGPVRGTVEDGIHTFRGLRYAAPPLGELRFKPPRKPEAWTEVADADHFGAAAIQDAVQPDMPSYETHSEDCLFLNVWTPALDAGKRPVMVWLHGGGYSTGAAGRPTYFGDHFARDGVVLVSVNHRLNVFGFTQLPDSWGPEYASSGLAGMLDIVEALRWVRDNVARFGGDPGAVTIFGESGGGGKVSLLMGMEPARGLFRKAVIESGAQLDATPRAYAEALGQALMDQLHVRTGDVAGLAAIDTQTLFKIQNAAVDQVKAMVPPGGFLDSGFTPSIDGINLKRGPFDPDASPLSANIPLMIGTNKDEMALFMALTPTFGNQTEAEFEAAVRKAYPDRADRLIPALKAAYPGYSPAYLMVALATAQTFWLNSITLAERKWAQHAAPVWMYMMTWESGGMGGRLKASHAMELSFVFGTFDAVRSFVGPGDGPGRMAAQMHAAWVAFARQGDPNTNVLPHWPTYDPKERATMIFNLESRVTNDPYGPLRSLMAQTA